MNQTSRLCAAAGLAAIVSATGALAHPPGADGHHDGHQHVASDPTKIRIWTNTRTKEIVRGAFLAARTVDDAVRVSIERETGDVVVFPFTDLSESDRAEVQRRMNEVKSANERLAASAVVSTNASTPDSNTSKPASKAPVAPAQAAPFTAFAPFVITRWDDRWLYVESDGLPHAPTPPLAPGAKPGDTVRSFILSHPMMVGITAWQQQVPLPQNYRGENAWRIPLKPVLADKPVSAKEQLFRGAIALAANGVPIFNPIKNDGRTDTFLAGELDEFGGHCGRADDYHYHIAPTHLQKYVGAGQPVAYALDGFPIYGHFDPSAKKGGPNEDQCCPLGSHEPLDWLNGHHAPAPAGSPPDTKGLYHYHASVKYPYLNGGMRGVVTVKDDQIDPQPRASSPRAALPPLRGAKITGFKATGSNNVPAWSLEYTQSGKKHFVNYRLENGKWIFDFVDPTGATKTDTYDATRPERGPRGGGRRGEGGNKRGNEGGENEDDRRPREENAGDGNGPRSKNPPPHEPSRPADDKATHEAQRGDALPWVTPAVTAPRVSFHTFQSAAVKSKVSYHLYTPAAYDREPARRFPVVYWLHGSGGGLPGIRLLAERFDAAIEAGKAPPCLVVFVNGLAEGMYVDWKDGRAPVESMIVHDLVPHIDGAHRTIATRAGRVLDGFSMGGYGAARLGFKFPELFGAVSMMGAGPMQEELVQTPRAGRQRAAEVLSKVYGGDQAYFRAVSPRTLAERNARVIAASVLVRQIIGDKDETYANNVAFHDHLERLKIPHEWIVLPGVPHDTAKVLDALGDSHWAFYRKAFDRQPPKPAAAAQPASAPIAGALLFTSPDVTDGRLAIDCTCDSKAAPRAPALAWDKPPEGTKAFAVIMHHITRDNDTHVYMVVANIPAAARELKSGSANIGTWGQNTINRQSTYAPPCSQGPGDKTYTITLYALSAEAKLPAGSPLTRDTLLAAIKETTLATAMIDVNYARAGNADKPKPRPVR